MFVRKKPNKSGIVSVQVIDKSSGKYRVRKTIGCSADPLQVNRLVVEAESWIKHYKGEIPIDFEGRRIQVEYFLDHISELSTCGVGMLLGRIFDEMGFNQIDSPLFRPLVLTRIEYPVSKLKTTDYWFKYHNTSVDVVKIYRYLDRLHKHEKEAIQGISYQHTQKILGGEIKIVFYDVTTIYFEAEREDDLRKNGFSKDGKHQNPQIVLGLLVSDGGYPLAYDIFEGNKYEGETMLPIIDAFKERYGFEQLTIVADAGLINHQNIEELSQRSYPYILGARIKNESGTIKKNILSLSLKDGQYKMIKKDDNTTLIISYSKARARKDRHNRERGLKKLEKQLSSGKLTKANINNRGYNKYLKLEGEVKIEIDKEKFALDAAWDGLKGYQTNTKLSAEEIIANYSQLWQIEKAFRISKHDLKIRPIYHRVQRRIESHICLSFVAYKIYKELERQLKEKKLGLSPEKAIEIARSIQKIKIEINPVESYERVLLTKEEQVELFQAFSLI
jgi:transposase